MFTAEARNIRIYSDTLSDSVPGELSNHTIQFTIDTDVAPSGYIEVVPPVGFSVVTAASMASTTYDHENVELYVNGTPRTATATADAANDGVTITPGSPGSIRYTFNSTTGVSNGDVLRLLIGDHTSLSTNGEASFSTSTGTTTASDDASPVQNSTASGTHSYTLTVGGGTEPAFANFLLALVDPVSVGPIDTRETIPPFRFNGAPTGEVGGTTLSIELSLETDEFAVCRYSTTASTSYFAMTNTFDSTGVVVAFGRNNRLSQ